MNLLTMFAVSLVIGVVGGIALRLFDVWKASRKK